MNTLVAALEFCARGWRVLPLWPVYRATGGRLVCVCRAGEGCRDAGKHPACAGGSSAATSDAARVERFWRAFSRRFDGDPGVGVATGGGLVVVDIDPRHTGDETWSRLCEGRGRVDTVTTLTGGGGVHLWFVGGRAIPSSVGRLGAGVDVRGEGGYVVAPPTLHESGRAYCWEASSDPTEGAEPATLPLWLAGLCVMPSCGESARALSVREGFAPGAIGAGERNDTLARVACSLRARGLEAEALGEALAKVNAVACAEPLPARELTRLVLGVCRRYPAGWSRGAYRATVDGEAAYQRATRAQGDYPWKSDSGAILAGLTSAVPADPGGPDV